MLQIKTLVKDEDPETPEILYIGWLDYDPFMKHNFEGAFVYIIDQITRSGIKKVLLDSGNRRHHPSEADFRDIISLFVSGLSNAGVAKMARIGPDLSDLEQRYRHYLYEIKEGLEPGFDLKHFNNAAETISWLQNDRADNLSFSPQLLFTLI